MPASTPISAATPSVLASAAPLPLQGHEVSDDGRSCATQRLVLRHRQRQLLSVAPGSRCPAGEARRSEGPSARLAPRRCPAGSPGPRQRAARHPAPGIAPPSATACGCPSHPAGRRPCRRAPRSRRPVQCRQCRAGILRVTEVYAGELHATQRLVLRHRKRQRVIRCIQPVDALAGERADLGGCRTRRRCLLSLRITRSAPVSCTPPQRLHRAPPSATACCPSHPAGRCPSCPGWRLCEAVSPASAAPLCPSGSRGPHR